jgi:hypothetical protein
MQELAMNRGNTLFLCGSGAFFQRELIETLQVCKRENMLIQGWLSAESANSVKKDPGNLFGFFRRLLKLIELDG